MSDQMKSEVSQLQLMPPPPGKCPICADNAHGDDLPHNPNSLFYQFWFASQWNRLPTWADAAALCTPKTKATLKKFLEENNVPAEKIGNLDDQPPETHQ